MKIIILFSLFALMKNEFLKDYRKSSPPNIGEIIQIIKQIDDTEFYKILRTPSVALSANQTTVKQFFDDVLSILEQFKLKFFNELFKYICDRLELYFLYAIELVKKSKNITNFQEKVVNKIGFESKHLCVVSFIFKMNNNADLSFHAVYFLQSLSNNLNFNNVTLLTILQKIHKWLKNRSVRVREGKTDILQHADMNEDLSKKSVEELISFMAEMKIKFMVFSDKFCSSSVKQPIVFKDFFVENQDYNMLHPFINYVYNEEKCQNTFENVEDLPQQQFFMAYYCSGIRNSPQYGIIEYMDYVKADENTRNRIGRNLLSKRKNCGTKDMTLKSLRLTINKNNYYFDDIKYSNAFSDILLLIFTKEGIKTLEFVKDFLEQFCMKNSTRTTTVTEVQAIRAQLYMFFFFYEEFISRKFEYIPLINKDFPMGLYKTDVRTLLYKLMNPFENVNDFKTNLCENIVHFKLYAILTAIHGENPDKHYFNEYYLTDPILNIHKILVNLNMMFFEYV